MNRRVACLTAALLILAACFRETPTAAVVDVASAAGVPVTAHAHGAQSIRDAIHAGVDSIEHASLIDEEGIALAIEHDVALSMDVWNGDWIAIEGRRASARGRIAVGV